MKKAHSKSVTTTNLKSLKKKNLPKTDSSKNDSHPKTTVFYSWQSDLPSETNRVAIRRSIQEAINVIQEIASSTNMVYDEATRDEPGSPDIPATIFSKVTRSDIFICDISTINFSDKEHRHTPNPNVLVELGYAIATLGWERIVMLFNDHFGDFDNDLPFDIDRRRITRYRIKDKSDKNGKSRLTGVVLDAINLILDKSPKKPSEISIDENAVKRKRDIENIEEIMSHIYIATMERFIEGLPSVVIDDIFFYWESVKARLESSYIYFYDKTLEEKMSALYRFWGESLGFGSYYGNLPSGNHCLGNFPGDYGIARKIEVAARKLNNAFKDLIQYVRENYVEINIDKLSHQALVTKLDFEKRNEDIFNDRRNK